MAGGIIRRGSVVLVRYPFTDQSGAKVRPAVIVSPDSLISKLDDVLCLFISSSMPDELLPTDFILEPNHPAFAPTGLKFRSVFRTHKLALIHKSLVERAMGVTKPSLTIELDRRLKIALGL